MHFITAHFAVEKFVARSESAKRSHCSVEITNRLWRLQRLVARNDSRVHSGTTATKSRTGFWPGIKNTLPFSRANQKVLDEPPSRFIARRILESAATGAVARIFANSASETSEQTPRKARSFVVVPAKVRRASCESVKPRMVLFPSTRNGPD